MAFSISLSSTGTVRGIRMPFNKETQKEYMQEYHKKRNKKSKESLILSMGGKCAICGYNKCNSALEVHHINPNDKNKNIKFNSAKITSVSLVRLLEELKKCILLCANCHREIHDGITALPQKIPPLDRSYWEWRNAPSYFSKKNEIEWVHLKCPLCGNKFHRLKSDTHLKKKTLATYCSRECNLKAMNIIRWKKNIPLDFEGNVINEYMKEIGSNGKTLGLDPRH